MIDWLWRETWILWWSPELWDLFCTSFDRVVSTRSELYYDFMYRFIILCFSYLAIWLPFLNKPIDWLIENASRAGRALHWIPSDKRKTLRGLHVEAQQWRTWARWMRCGMESAIYQTATIEQTGVESMRVSGVGSNLQVGAQLWGPNFFPLFCAPPPHEGAQRLFVTDWETIEVSPSVGSAVCTATGEVGRGAIKVMGPSAVPCSFSVTI